MLYLRGWKPTRLQLAGAAGFLASWAGTSILCYCKGVEWQGWIELFNGATWPSNSGEMAKGNWWLFSLICGLRTTVNLGFIVTVIGAVFWFYFGKGRRLLELSSDRLIKHRDNQMIGKMAALIEEEFPGALTPEISKKFNLELREFMKDKWTPS